MDAAESRISGSFKAVSKKPLDGNWNVFMLFFYKPRLVFLSTPKTGTTAILAALKPRASMIVSGPPEMKHVTYGGFMAHVAPWIKASTGLDRQDYEVVTVMREPLDWLGSWYRYRTRNELKDPDHPHRANYTGHLTYEEFVADVLRPDETRPGWASVGRPSDTARHDDGTIGVDRLFAYENLPSFVDYLSQRMGKPVETEKKNVSPSMPLALSAPARTSLQAHFADDVRLHASLRADGKIEHPNP